MTNNGKPSGNQNIRRDSTGTPRPVTQQRPQGGVTPSLAPQAQGDGTAPVAKKRRRASTRGKIIVAVILVVYTILLSSITYFIMYKPHTSSKQFTEVVTDEFGNEIIITHDFEPVDGIYNILLLGHDKAAMLTDVFMILNINNNAGSIYVKQIPRDTYVRSVDGVGITTYKINELFIDHYNDSIRKGEKSDKAYKLALESVAGLLEDNLGVCINFSAIMDLTGFRNIVDAIGGVRMHVPADMQYYDPAQDLTINIPAGEQVLNGMMAEGFVRYRSGFLQGDLGRVNSQKLFLLAFFNQLKSSISLTNVSMITNLAEEVLTNLETDIGVSDAVFFGRSALSLDMSNIVMLMLPGQTNATHYVMNREASLAIINKYFNVYDKSLTDGIFDTKGMFTNPDDASVYELYYADAENVFDDNIYTGDDINNGDIYIPRT